MNPSILDLHILYFFYNLGQSYSWIASTAVFVSGPLSVVCIPALVVGFFSASVRHFMNTFTTFFLALFTSWISARILKELFQRVRPFYIHTDIVPLAHQSGYSFPSEHASVYGALTVLLFHIDYKLGIVGSVVMVVVGISRLVMGVHYPIDVLVGFLLGGIITFFIIKGLHKVL